MRVLTIILVFLAGIPLVGIGGICGAIWVQESEPLIALLWFLCVPLGLFLFWHAVTLARQLRRDRRAERDANPTREDPS
jgi:hypothetical protein